MCSFCCSLEYQSFVRVQEGKIALQKKVYRAICLKEITSFIARPPCYIFLLLSLSTLSSFPSDLLVE